MSTEDAAVPLPAESTVISIIADEAIAHMSVNATFSKVDAPIDDDMVVPIADKTIASKADDTVVLTTDTDIDDVAPIADDIIVPIAHNTAAPVDDVPLAGQAVVPVGDEGIVPTADIVIADQAAVPKTDGSVILKKDDASLWSNTEEDEDCCRVCHGEAEELRPLFHPCRCSGSIKFVHQDCLQMWLKISNQSNPKCELCGEHFHFRNIYTSGEDKPPSLSVFEFTYGLCLIASKSAAVVFELLTATILWSIGLPFFTYWIVEFIDAFIFNHDVLLMFSLKSLPGDLSSYATCW